MESRTEYVVKMLRASRGQEIDACRAILTLLERQVARFECDLPWSKSDEWSMEVHSAAERLTSLSRGGRGQNDQYRATGILPNDRGENWAALVTFAPYAFDAGAWGETGLQLVSMSDEGSSLVVSLTDNEKYQLTVALPRVEFGPLPKSRFAKLIRPRATK